MLKRKTKRTLVVKGKTYRLMGHTQDYSGVAKLRRENKKYFTIKSKKTPKGYALYRRSKYRR